MANLALKAVLWGADKIPDSVFESIPGGFFKSKDGHGHGRRSNGHDKRRRDSKRYSDDEHDNHRRHRHHHHHHDDDHDRRRSRGHRRDRSRLRRRRSYEDSDDDLSDAPSRTRSESRHRRRNSHGDGGDHYYDDRHDYADNHDDRRLRDDDYDGAPARPPYPESNEPRRYDDNAFAPGGRATAAAAAAGAAAATAHHDHDHDYSSHSPPTESVSSNGFEQGYVPYSDIYGQPTHQPASRSFEHPGAGDGQPMSPVARPPHTQNPYAQDSAYEGQPNYIAPNDGYDARDDPHYYDPHVRDDRYTDYTPRPGSTHSPPRSRSRRGRAYSPSLVTHDSRHDNDSRRTRSERRSDRTAGRSKSKVREAFDPSKRGLGYGAVGALAGGLVGSEIGKGPLPAVIGAMIGGAGANAFQARERRKEARRNEQYLADGMYGRRNARMTRMDSSGYYSD